MNSRPAPFNYSTYVRTHNNAIDLVAQAVGYIQTVRRPVRALVLKPMSYELFRAGVEVLMKKKIDPITELTFDGYKVIKGGRAQFESLVIDWLPITPEQLLNN
jgi:hypothetical protein